MTEIFPSYYGDFHCTASHCSDNCCIGWEIDIDPDTLSLYKKADTKKELKIMEHIDTSGDEPHFILRDDGRCPFLDEHNLCDVYRTLGEQALCQICSLHPRFINTYGDVTEYGLDLCCEEAARIILSQQTFCTYKQGKITKTLETAGPSEASSAFFHALNICRNKIFTFISSGIYELEPLMQSLLEYGELLDDRVFDENYLEMERTDIPAPDAKYPILMWDENILAKCIAFLRSLTPLSVSWHNFLADAARDLKHILPLRESFLQAYPAFHKEARHLLNHYIYHYFLSAVWEDEVFSKVFFAVFIVRMTELFDTAFYYYHKSFSLQDQIFICSQLSKEIEYCSENLEKVLDFAYNC